VKENWITDLYAQNLDRSQITSVLEIGAGCGLSGLTASLLLQKHNNTTKNRLQKVRVVLTDFNSAVLENLQQNIELNDLSDICSVIGLDFYEQTGTSTKHWIAMNGATIEPVDLVLGADIICEPTDAIAVANTLHDVLNPNGIAYIVCADPKHRFGVDYLEVECQRVGLLVTTAAITCSETSDTGKDTIKLTQDDLRNLALTSGFVECMNLTLFVIRKIRFTNG
jgi:SAM-dependent methyltransferase